MTRRRLQYVIPLTALLVLVGGAAQAQERVQPGAVEIQTQQLPQPEKVAVRVRPHAELGVAHVAHYPAPATEGQSIAIEIKVENEGTAPSSGDETLHFDCQNKQSGGPACPFGAGQRSLPVIHSLKEPYPTGPYGHSEQLLTTPTWKPGSYELTAWIAEPGKSAGPEIFTATIEVKPKLQLGPANKAQTAMINLGLPDLAARIDPFGWGIKVSVKNQGGKPSGQTTFRLTCHQYAGTQWLGICPGWTWNNAGFLEGNLPSVDPGEELVLPAPSPNCFDTYPGPPVVDLCKVTVVADYGNKVAEIYETNNTKTYNLEAIQ